MRTTFIAILLGLAFAIGGTTPSLAQAEEKITGKTCNELFRSCFRICAIHIGEPAYRACEADCNNGQRSCRSTGVWKSKNATVTVQTPAKKKR
jgi:hypothetical protein